MAATEHSRPNAPVACTVCQKEVPASEAYVQEAGDYVYYFCGPDCFETWRRAAEAQYKPPTGKGEAD